MSAEEENSCTTRTHTSTTNSKCQFKMTAQKVDHTSCQSCDLWSGGKQLCKECSMSAPTNVVEKPLITIVMPASSLVDFPSFVKFNEFYRLTTAGWPLNGNGTISGICLIYQWMTWSQLSQIELSQLFQNNSSNLNSLIGVSIQFFRAIPIFFNRLKRVFFLVRSL